MVKKLTTDAFVEKARLCFGEKYSYAKVRYVNTVTKIIITCPKHGDFEQTPARHLHEKCGCNKCAAVAKEAQVAAFVEKARSVHGNKYDYRLVDYIDTHTAVTIHCPQHGPFRLLPNSHLGGKGCKQCTAGRYAHH